MYVLLCFKKQTRLIEKKVLEKERQNRIQNITEQITRMEQRKGK
jgi:hypothetical protein